MLELKKNYSVTMVNFDFLDNVCHTSVDEDNKIWRDIVSLRDLEKDKPI